LDLPLNTQHETAISITATAVVNIRIVVITGVVGIIIGAFIFFFDSVIIMTSAIVIIRMVFFSNIPVVPHKAVAEVSKMGNYTR